MIDMGTIYCSEAQAVPLIIGVDTVYVHTEIEKVETDHEGKPTDNLYKCKEVQYTKDEYIKLISEQNASTLTTIDILMSEVIPSLMV